MKADGINEQFDIQAARDSVEGNKPTTEFSL